MRAEDGRAGEAVPAMGVLAVAVLTAAEEATAAAVAAVMQARRRTLALCLQGPPGLQGPRGLREP
jgi:hypothetical protein